MSKQFKPIYPEYYEIFDAEILRNREKISTVHYFNINDALDTMKGKIVGIKRDETNEEHLIFQPHSRVRIDRIITINGKPGPAYDEYDSFANACLDCMGGMDDD